MSVEALLGVAMAALAGVVGWLGQKMISRLVEHESRIAKLEAKLEVAKE